MNIIITMMGIPINFAPLTFVNIIITMMGIPISIAIVLIMVSVKMGIAVQGGLNGGDMFRVHFVATHSREK